MTFKLEAKAYVLRKTLGSVTVDLNDSECQTQAIDEGSVTTFLREAVQIMVRGNTALKIRGEGGHATITVTGGLTLHVTLEIDVPNWFNADADIDFHYRVFLDYTSAARNVRVTPSGVGLDVSWHFLEHVLSLGCTGAVQGALEHVMQPLLKETFGTQVGTLVRLSLQQGTETFIELLNAVDDNNRTWRRFSARTSDGEIVFTFCPDLSSPTPPGGTIGNGVVVAPIVVPLR
jgi:hypothetical protein